MDGKNGKSASFSAAMEGIGDLQLKMEAFAKRYEEDKEQEAALRAQLEQARGELQAERAVKREVASKVEGLQRQVDGLQRDLDSLRAMLS